jgi:hypothetical protein
MFRRTDDFDDTATPAPDALPALKAALAGLPRPPRLLAAEAAVRQTREQKAAAEVRRRDAYAALRQEPGFNGTWAKTPEISALDAEVQAADAAIETALTKLNRAREDFGPAWQRTVAPHVASTARAVLSTLDQLDRLWAIVRQIEMAAARDGQMLPFTRCIRHEADSLRRSMKRAIGSK